MLNEERVNDPAELYEDAAAELDPIDETFVESQSRLARALESLTERVKAHLEVKT